VGPAFFERLSTSNLINAGLGDLCVGTLDAYVAAAVGLAADPARRLALRHGLRGTIRGTALGRPDLFVADFQDAVREAVG
jgi:predicted O-linked N-acetylglucosamine transferase (SPINDLY family)